MQLSAEAWSAVKSLAIGDASKEMQEVSFLTMEISFLLCLSLTLLHSEEVWNSSE